MKTDRRLLVSFLVLCGISGALPLGAAAPTKPRLLVLPWLVIDRTTNRDCNKPGGSPGAPGDEARALAQTAQQALDAEMHAHRMMTLIPRKEWEPQWQQLRPGRIVRQGAGCAVCTPAGELLHYDRPALQALAQSVGADYIWLGATVVPLTPERRAAPPDDCCRDALASGRKEVLARSSVVLVRASDGEIVWQRDARRLEREVPHRVGKMTRSPATRRRYSLDATAHLLTKAFRREHPEALL
jgi:hypothetical protein